MRSRRFGMNLSLSKKLYGAIIVLVAALIITSAISLYSNHSLISGYKALADKDADGKEFVKERIELAKTRGKGWQNYKFSNPLTKKNEEKTAYIEKADDVIVGSGVYK
jgi:hypothetical protein